MNNNRGKSAAERLILNTNKSKSNIIKESQINIETKEPMVLNKRNIEKLIKEQGNSKRSADSIRINPILASALKYWTSIAEPDKSKPDIIEETLLKSIPEDILIHGYEMAKKQNKI